ncbi:hypothetical protein GCM10007897_15120 [Sphingobium jiangsuense]|uniref:Uncharacterized protein n=1 Tax=Sphingobium jiangsuense TaxID=870476 RepID=A0A7W6BLX7_9SPHN|nr:hypothetical protein [Sphingobium jiangsuense]MBB3925043.1 hypothetical protein [Sphingobium jiangsuense]GLT00128.1 hypothetical protein GCM10007897_15120 [Sphingobium jiangsuense]
MTDKTKKAFVISSFRDAGTERRFEAGTTPDLTEGEFINYKAAGLVRAPTADELKAKSAS